MKKSPGLAALLSVFPGVGQVYVGYYGVGFRTMIIFASVITVLSNGMMRGMEPMLGIFLAFFFFYQILDAARRARLYNRTIEGGGQPHAESLPELPDNRPGPIFGVLIMVFGFFLLMESRFGFDLYWVREWWPILLIGAGAYITWKNLQERQQTRP